MKSVLVAADSGSSDPAVVEPVFAPPASLFTARGQAAEERSDAIGLMITQLHEKWLEKPQTSEEASEDAGVAQHTAEQPFTASDYDHWNIAVYDHGRGDGWKEGYIKGIEIQKGISASMLSRMLE